MYFDLLKKLAPLDRCHCGPEMDLAYQLLLDHYEGARLLRYGEGYCVNHWMRPPYWICTKAELRNQRGDLIISREDHRMAVFSYSPAVDEVMGFDELQNHILTDATRPEDICFHFRNQYRHWNPEWGFCLPYNTVKSLPKSEKYRVLIESRFDKSKDLIQSDYHHQGESDDMYLLIGHFDHPGQVNDGLAGCIAAYEIIKRLKGRRTRFSYWALASVEIVGSVFYLEEMGKTASNIRETLFLTFCGVDSPFAYQNSFRGDSLIDRIMKFLFAFDEKGGSSIYNHRELVGNDESVFDSAHYEIPSSTLLRWPFQEYHTDRDSMEITLESKMEEYIKLCLNIINIIENNFILKACFQGLPCLSHPEINLYLTPDLVSGKNVSFEHRLENYSEGLDENEIAYLTKNTHLLNPFMQNILRFSDGMHTILDIAEMSRLPFHFVANYSMALRNKGLLQFQ